MSLHHKIETETHSRREFMQDILVSGIGMIGIGTFMQSCAEKEIVLSSGLAQSYVGGILSIIKNIRERELQQIRNAATIAVQARLQGHQLFAHITGAMFPGEIDNSRPGSPHIFIYENIKSAARDDVVITNDPETARGLGEQYVKIIGITTPSVVNFNTPPGVLENMGTIRIEDVSDLVIDCHVPFTDGILKVEGIDIPICPASCVIHSLIYYALTAEIVEGLTNSGIYPQIG